MFVVLHRYMVIQLRSMSFIPWLLLLGVVWPSCGSASSESKSDFDLPKTIVRDRARILDQETRQALTAFDADGTLHFGGNATEMVQLFEPGQVLVSDITTAAPYGLLRKITSVAQVNGEVVVQTEAAALYEVIEEGGFDEVISLSSEDIASPVPGTSARAFELDLSVILDDLDGNNATTDDQLRVEGSLSFDAYMGLSWKIFDSSGLFDDLNPFDSFKLTFRVGVDINERVNMSFVLPRGYSYDRDQEIYRYPFTPFTIFVGPVPVVLAPSAVLNAGIKGVAGSKEQSFSLDQSFRAALGAKCDTGGCSGSQGLESEFEAGPANLSPEIQSYTAKVTGSVTMEYEVLVYGVAGPFASVEPYVNFNVTYPSDPVWTLDGGLKGNHYLQRS